MRWLLKLIFGGGGVSQIAQGAADVGRVFVGDKAAREEAEAAAYQAALAQFGAEFGRPARSWFDVFVDGLNRLPRPVLAFSTLGLFVYAMNDPVSFTVRMQGLAHVPEPLWWIMAAVVTFYFGARETHKFRQFRASSQAEVQATVDTIRAIEAIPDPAPPDDPAEEDENPAIAAWRASRAQS